MEPVFEGWVQGQEFDRFFPVGVLMGLSDINGVGAGMVEASQILE